MRRVIRRGGRRNWNAAVVVGIVLGAGPLVGRDKVTVGRVEVLTLDGIPASFQAWATSRFMRTLG
jgi:hypothetical protein